MLVEIVGMVLQTSRKVQQGGKKWLKWRKGLLVEIVERI